MWGMIATWRMAYDGVKEGVALLKDDGMAGDAIETAIKAVEDYPYYKSVGYGGLPNEHGVVELDAAYMDGDNFDVGAVAGAIDVKNPISVARKLSADTFNIFLVGNGVREYAQKEGFELKEMLTPRAQKLYEKRVKEIREQNLSPYDGHDTVGMVVLDTHGKMVSATSTSGLFMKKEGRIGDSALSGSGFYVDSEIGGATATGLGEDLMKGCVSYEIVRLMGEGLSPMAACEKAVTSFTDKLKRRKGKAGAFSVVAMNQAGQWGIATNVEFSFVVATAKEEPTIYLAYPKEDGTAKIEVASETWLAAYEKRIKAPVE